MNIERVVLIVIGLFLVIGTYEGLKDSRWRPPKRKDK